MAITKIGTGTLTLSGANSYTGGTTITNGGVVVTNSFAFGYGAVTAGQGGANGYVQLTSGLNITNALYTYNGFANVVGGLSVASGSATWSGPIYLMADGTRISGNTTTTSTLNIAGPISDNGSNYSVLFRFGNIVLSNPNNNWGGATTMSQGLLQLGTNNGLPTTTSLTLASTSAATFDLNGKNQTLVGMTRGSVSSATISNSVASTTSVLTTTGTSIYGGTILDGTATDAKVAVTVNGGSLTLTNANPFSGNTTISGGTLALSNAATIANSPNIIVGGGATFDVSARTGGFTLGAAQTLSNSTSTALLAGNVSCGSGKVALTFAPGALAFNVTNGTLTLSNLTTLTVDNTGAMLALGSYKIIGALAGGAVAGTLPAVTVGGGGAASFTTLQIIGSELYLNVGSATSLALVSSAPTNGYLASVNFTATISTNGTAVGNATGNVTFSANGIPFSTNAVSAGNAASASVNNLPRGTNVILAVYPGDGSYLGSTNALNQVVTNHPPVAGHASYTRNAGIYQLNITISQLLTNVTDVDSDTATLTALGNSTNGIILATNATLISYYNTNSVADEFTYTVSDGFGGTSTGIVTLTINTNSVFGQSSPSISTTGGAPTISFAGIPGYSYGVQRSTNVSFVPFDIILTTNAPGGGLFNYTDNSAPTPAAFYRLQFNP